MLLRPIGFRKRGRTFNRSAEDGVVQVINLQAGQSPIGGTQPQPPGLAHLRPDLRGRFAVNLGIHVKEVWEQDSARRCPGFVQDYHCQIRMRLGSAGARGDRWWPLDTPLASLTDDVSRALLGDGLAFLDRFGRRDAIVAEWVALNDGPGRLSARARVDVAIILVRRGDRATAVRLLREQIDRAAQRGHVDYVRRLADDLGLSL